MTTNKPPYLVQGVKEFIEVLEKQNAPALYTLSPEAARQVLNDAQSKMVKQPDVEIKDTIIIVGAHKVETRIVYPKNVSGLFPMIYYIHGGGWVLGNKDTHHRLIAELATLTKFAVVFPSYSPSPEAKYPVAIEQCFGVLDYLARNGNQHKLDMSKIAVAGDSVGGNMTIAMCLLAKKHKFPNILFQLLFYPVTDASMESDSYEQFADGPWLTKKAMHWFMDAYVPEEKRKDILVSPILATSNDLKNMPSTLIITAENDVLRDEGEKFAQNLDRARVKTSCVRFNGTIHDFVMLNALSETAPTRSAISLAAAKLREMFNV